VVEVDGMRFLDPKNRRDHIVPRVFLRGFIHSGRDTKDGPLEVFHLSSNTWGAPQTPDELCAEVGFYDYSVERADTAADDVFKDLEDNFAIVRERLRRVAFSDWKRDRDFLLRFGKMLVVRSKMFREGVIAAAAKQSAFRVLEVDGNKMRVEPMRLGTEPNADKLLKNRSITEMRTAIEEGAAEWAEWDWGLRRAPSVDCPFITSDHPPVMSGDGPDGLRAYATGQFRIVIPLGWDFALVGGPKLGEVEGPVYLSPSEMDEHRIIAASGALDILISPIKLLDMTWFGRVRRAVPITPR
jgi:hypothetical protein